MYCHKQEAYKKRNKKRNMFTVLRLIQLLHYAYIYSWHNNAISFRTESSCSYSACSKTLLSRRNGFINKFSALMQIPQLNDSRLATVTSCNEALFGWYRRSPPFGNPALYMCHCHASILVEFISKA